ncbi:LuxR C-terminal-related transcriptional regulator [Geodermatophilus sp. SYSU D00814]
MPATAATSRTAAPRESADGVAAAARGALPEAEDAVDRAVHDLRRTVREILRHRPAADGGLVVQFDVDGLDCQVTVVDAPAQPAGVSLSPREEEIVRMVARGCTNRMIASVLDISEWTVGTHLRRVFTKLEVNSRAAMVARLLADGDPRPPSTRPRDARPRDT